MHTFMLNNLNKFNINLQKKNTEFLKFKTQYLIMYNRASYLNVYMSTKYNFGYIMRMVGYCLIKL